MIKTELLKDGTLIKHYSDAGFMLLQNETGLKYAEPIDAYPCKYTYVETKVYIKGKEPVVKEEIEKLDEETILKAKAYDIITGGEQ